MSEDKPKTEDVEAHRRRWPVSEDAEPPEDLGEVTKDDSKEDDEDFEAHRKRAF